ncbi:MAG TPA: hypothetical protein VNS58_23340 [Puia sp.]|nr:hypothetical protein [Puia sp.]
MDKSRVDHGISPGCSIAQAFQIFQISSMHLGAGGSQGQGG